MLTRRRFLQSGAAAGAAFGFPQLLLTTKIRGESAPNNRLNLALIGCGLMMGSHRGVMLGRDDVQVVALCDVRKDARDKYLAEVEKKSKGSCQVFNEYEAVLARPEIDAVLVATPDHWHAAISIAAMRAGKDVYCQKPMTLTVREGRMMVETAREHGRIVQVGTQQRSERAFRRACEIVRNGWIGKIKEVWAGLGEFPQPETLPEQPVPAGFDFDRWLGPAPWAPYHEKRVKGDYGGGWRCYWDYGSRKNGDWGAHHFDIIQWALGMDESGPVEFIPKGFEGAEFQAHRYADGITVYRDRGPRKGASGTDHMIRFIGDKGEVFVSRGDKLETAPDATLAKREPSPDEVHLYESTHHEGNWLECIRSRRQPICPAAIGHRTGTICQIAGTAERIGRALRWDPRTEQITGDPAAARWLDRPRRAGYPL